MNQKQRDYLIKRLTVVKGQKIGSITFPSYDKVIINMVKKISDKQILKLVHKRVDKKVRDKVGSYTRYSSDLDLEIGDIVSNAKECDEQVRKEKELNNAIKNDKIKSITEKYNEMCDKIIFAESYEEASKLMEEFLKF